MVTVLLFTIEIIIEKFRNQKILDKAFNKWNHLICIHRKKLQRKIQTPHTINCNCKYTKNTKIKMQCKVLLEFKDCERIKTTNMTKRMKIFRGLKSNAMLVTINYANYINETNLYQAKRKRKRIMHKS